MINGYPLATVEDLNAFVGQTIPAASADLAVTLASQIVRSACRQTITKVVDDVVRLEGGANLLLLPERPVVSVKDVTGLFYATTADPFYYDIPDAAALFGPLPTGIWILDVHGRVRLPRGSAWPPVVQLTYTHGYDEVPDDLRAVCLAAAARKVLNPTGAVRVRAGGLDLEFPSARSGPSAGAVGGLMLTPDELRICNRYRKVTAG